MITSAPHALDSLRNESFDLGQCLAAIRGERVPDHLGSEAARASIVRGIRRHFTFATNPDVSILCYTAAELVPQLMRARNARLIMSNVIPSHMEDPETQPYCIWSPDFAAEETYRRLVAVYPSMRYQVGRACAAAGYAELYSELNLLPDVSTAEEARESGNDGSRTIYKKIMAFPVRYAVMDDYNRSVCMNDPPSPAFLNGDTAVRWYLSLRLKLQAAETVKSSHLLHWDIEEDKCIDDARGDFESRSVLTEEEVQLLYNPLPLDLPTVKKDLLILMAAHDGNVDRYARLQRPSVMSSTEFLCVIRGIYHSTMYARWWANELEKGGKRLMNYHDGRILSPTIRIKMAINARRIMNNDISGFTPETVERPYLIWWPLKPRDETLSRLARKCPKMKEQIAITCIICDYESDYDLLEVKPSWELWKVSKLSPNKRYLADLEKRASEQGLDIENGCRDWCGETDTLESDLEPTSIWLFSRLTFEIMDSELPGGIPFGTYFGEQSGANQVERHVWASHELLRKVDFYCDGVFTGDATKLDEEPLPEEVVLSA